MSQDLNDLHRGGLLPDDLALKTQPFDTWSTASRVVEKAPGAPRAFDALPADTLSDLLLAAQEPIDWLIEDLIIANQVTLVAGAPKAGKSTLLLAIVRSIILGRSQFAGFKMTGKQGTVTYFYEDGRRTFAGRVASLGLTEGIFGCGERDARKLGLHQHSTAQIVEGMLDRAEACGSRVLVVDTLRRWFSVNENEQEECESLIAEFQSQAQARSITVILVHHTKKLGQRARPPSLEDVRGASALTGAPDQIILAYRKRTGGGMTPVDLWVEGRDIEFPFKASVEPDPGSGEWRRALGTRMMKESEQKEALCSAVVALHTADGKPVSLSRAAKTAREAGANIANDLRRPLLDALVSEGRLLPCDGRFIPPEAGR